MGEPDLARRLAAGWRAFKIYRTAKLDFSLFYSSSRSASCWRSLPAAEQQAFQVMFEGDWEEYELRHCEVINARYFKRGGGTGGAGGGGGGDGKMEEGETAAMPMEAVVEEEEEEEKEQAKKQKQQQEDVAAARRAASSPTTPTTPLASVASAVLTLASLRSMVLGDEGGGGAGGMTLMTKPSRRRSLVPSSFELEGEREMLRCVSSLAVEVAAG